MPIANDNGRLFTAHIHAETQGELLDLVTALLRELEPDLGPGEAPKEWLVRHGQKTRDGLPSAIVQRRSRRPN